jgi:bifunctional NMN adenylyltransferase/nudix hydrolase
MNDKPFDFLVFIGRFQPFHNGHLAVVQASLKHAEQLIVLCGSAHQPRSTRNPWTVMERESMIRGCLSDEESARVHVSPLMDVLYNDEAWVRNIQATVNGIVTAHHKAPHAAPVIGLIGHDKDHSSYYLNLFPQWESVNVPTVDGLSATPLRYAFFDSSSGGRTFLKEEAPHALPEAVSKQLTVFADSEHFRHVQQEHAFIEDYRKGWENAPYPPTFVTVDAVVVQSGHVLLVERNAWPGKGLLALPGGFVDPSETLICACLRELREETRLKVPSPVLRGSIKSNRVFDDPHRSMRGRTITEAFYIELEPNSTLPRVKGGDDARHALWVPLASLDPSRMFEDHYFIIQEMTGM